MNTLPKFELGERHILDGAEYSWRLKDGELRYRGTLQYANAIIGRIPVSAKRIARFAAALDLLDVWSWRDSYNPADAGFEVMDGSVWWFKAEMDGRACKCAGGNAYPAFENSQQTSLEPERFGLLCTCLREVFGVDSYLHQARLLATRDAESNTQRAEERRGENSKRRISIHSQALRPGENS